MTEQGFIKGKSDNLPKVDSFMLTNFIGSHPDFVSAEIKGVKVSRSAREDYGDNAIGYVLVKSEGNICTVMGKISPEHNIRRKQYTVSLVCDENSGVIQSVKCHDCAAAHGGCKHAIAFLTWIYRRSEEPSTTAIECYWKKPVLSSVRTSLKFVKVRYMGNAKIDGVPTSDGTFLAAVVDHSLKLGRSESVSIKFYKTFSDMEGLSLNHLVIRFFETSVEKEASNS